ncbi:MAG: DUF721 domain-containing protein [Hahellaceae bacterium]|jgi:hypothetical protein|nr:DUF721 domain-containing protein [Hahellaceae bacterium]MCP5210810.1 DUF721 domain-containing protein [Hahellaceae bacterium]
MKDNKGPVPLTQLLQSQSDTLKKLFRTANIMSDLEAVLRGALPQNLKMVVTIRFYRGGVLAVNVPSGMYATLLRMNEQNVIKELKNHASFSKLRCFEVKVRPVLNQRKSSKKAMYMSEENSRLLKDVAGETEDINLQRTLERLANRAQKK